MATKCAARKKKIMDVTVKTTYVAGFRAFDTLEEAEAYAAEQTAAEVKKAEEVANGQAARWARAVKAVRKGGVTIKQNVYACCRGCVGKDKLGVKDEEKDAYAWTFAGQGHGTMWVGNDLQLRTTDRWNRANKLDEVYFNHGNGGGEAVKAAFEAEGFEVVWDGTDVQCVVVKVNQ